MPKWLDITIKLLPVCLLIVAGIGTGIFFLARLESDNNNLQKDVSELQASVNDVRTSINDVRTDVSTGVGEVKANQQRILDALDNIEVALGNHVHDPDGIVRVLPPSNRVTLPSN